jgi:type 1 glutamine amidotransferase
MQKRGRHLLLLAVLSLGALTAAPRVLLVTGGHNYDNSFHSLFDDNVDVKSNPKAFDSDMRRNYDVLVLYDMADNLTEKQKTNLMNFAGAGKGVLILHHAICSYNDWPWYREFVGGAYLMKSSTYKHDEDMNVKVTLQHAVTAGLHDMRIHDETYHGMWISPEAKVLLQTDNPTSDGPLAWISAYDKSRVVYIQLGHGKEAHRNSGYRQLIKNALEWCAGKSS